MRDYLFLTILVVAFSTTIAAYQQPNITEVQDSFGDVYSIEPDDGFLQSERPVEFTDASEYQICATEVEHEEDAELKFDRYRPMSGFKSIDQNCVTYNFTAEHYPTSGIGITVEDNNVPYDLSDGVAINYNNPINPIENIESKSTETGFNQVLVAKDEYESLQQNQSDLLDTVEDQNQTISELESQLEEKENRIDELQSKINEITSGLSGFFASLL